VCAFPGRGTHPDRPVPIPGARERERTSCAAGLPLPSGGGSSSGGSFDPSDTVGRPETTVTATGGDFDLAGACSAAIPTFQLGDLSCDGLVNFGDINPFVLYLSNFAVWEATYTSARRPSATSMATARTRPSATSTRSWRC
jgi:hypothetical protein